MTQPVPEKIVRAGFDALSGLGPSLSDLEQLAEVADHCVQAFPLYDTNDVTISAAEARRIAFMTKEVWLRCRLLNQEFHLIKADVREGREP